MRLPALAIAATLAALLLAPVAQAATGRLIPVDYSDALDERPARLVAASDAGFAPTREGLAERVVGVQRDTLHQCIAEHLFPEARLEFYDSQDQGYAELTAGRIDALMADAVEAYARFLSTEQGRGFGFLGDEQFDRACHDIAVTRSESGPGLRDKLDDALDELEGEGTLQRLRQKYFTHPEPDLE